MNIKNKIDQELWENIEKNYENESYSSAIIDAMFSLTETIRNKTGLEGDGSNLIGQAFGGSNPMLQLNKLQTESEKNIQKGMQDLLRGLYTAIRNPRSHDKFNDTKEDADSIIFFINYLLKIISSSRNKFEETTFLDRVFDKHYVKTNEYSQLLVNEIPKRQRTNVAVSVILKRKQGDIYKLGYFFKALLNILDENGITQLSKVISEELKYTSSNEDIRTILHLLPGDYWAKLDRVVKMRIENILLENVREGKCDTVNGKCIKGFLGTWIETDHLRNFSNIGNWTVMIVEKLEEGNDEEKAYIENFFWKKICNVNCNNIHYYLEYYIKTGLENREEEIINKLKSIILFDKKHPWREIFKEEIKDIPELEYDFSDDDLPF